MKFYRDLSKNGQTVVSRMMTLDRQIDNYKKYLDKAAEDGCIGGGSDGYMGRVMLERREDWQELHKLRIGDHTLTRGLDAVTLSAFYDIAKNSCTEKEFIEPDWFISDELIQVNDTAALDQYLNNVNRDNHLITSAQRVRILEKYQEILTKQPEPTGFLQKLCFSFSYGKSENLKACAQLLETNNFDNLQGAKNSGQLAKIAKLKTT